MFLRHAICRSVCWTGLFFFTAVVTVVGCGGNTDPSASADSESGDQTGINDNPIQSGADIAASGGDPEVGAETFAPDRTSLPDSVVRNEDGLEDSSGEAMTLTGDESPTGTAPAPPNPPIGYELVDRGFGAQATPEMIAAPQEDVAGQRTLRADLSPEQLVKFLEDFDRDMQTLAGSRNQLQDAEKASKMMQQFAKYKLQASLQLQKHADATEDQRVEGMRGQLQALSHLSAMGDIASAKALENLAKENLSSNAPSVASDSRIVLIGFAIDALRAGDEAASERVVSLIEETPEQSSSDIPAVLMMAEAKNALESYGLIDEAAAVRRKILELYADSPDPTIAKVAADAAGSAQFDDAKRLLNSILNDDSVSLAQWSETVNDLVSDSPEMNTVEFLGTAALQLEAAGHDEYVAKTFELLSASFDDQQSAAAQEVAAAQKAMQARRDVIGSKPNFDSLPTVDGTGIPESLLNNKVVLMPFWAIVVPESLQVVTMLKEIQSRHPDDVSIVGMNLDPEHAPLRELVATNQLDFPSYRSVSSATQNVANPVAAEFGMVSLPFVAILDRDGTVAALDFTGRRLSAIVDELVSQDRK